MLLLQHPGSLSLDRIHPKLKYPFNLSFAVAIGIYLGTVYNCLRCTANKDTAVGTPEMFMLCECKSNILVWHGITLAGLGVEIAAWKPWRRVGSICSLISWKVGIILIPCMLLTVVVATAVELPSSDIGRINSVLQWIGIHRIGHSRN